VSCAKTAEPIEVPFQGHTPVSLTNHVVDGGTHWCHLANTTEPAVCGGGADLCQIARDEVITYH